MNAVVRLMENKGQGEMDTDENTVGLPAAESRGVGQDVGEDSRQEQRAQKAEDLIHADPLLYALYQVSSPSQESIDPELWLPAAGAEALRRVERLRSELIANVSHEIRTPLGLIEIAITSLLMDDVQFDPETQRQFLKGIKEEVDKLKAIVENSLALGRIESGRLHLRKRATDIGSLVRQATSSMAVQCGERRLVHRVPDEPLIAKVDPGQIEQVLRNLLSNAVKYSPVGARITITGYQEGSQIVICVSDQGIGIPPQELEQVFKPFYRIDSEAAHTASEAVLRRVGGVGLGLSVCRGIVQAHNGRMWAESTLGEGSRFYFALPADAG